jgi:FkbM family methyltransferase
MKLAASAKGIKDTSLVAVEASAAHCEFIRQHLKDNGLVESDVEIINALIDVEDGSAHLSSVGEARENYGAQKVDEGAPIRSVGLGGLLHRLGRVDVVHCDIQGAEGDVLEKTIGPLSATTRRIIVGTHSRAIEDRLFRLFEGGWLLENEKPCQLMISGGRPRLAADGEQIWSNPLLAG